MLNRRQVRKKVFQQLYAFQQSEDGDRAMFDKKLQQSFKDFYQLFLFQVDTILKVKDACAKQKEIEEQKFNPSKRRLEEFDFIENNTVLTFLQDNVHLTEKLKGMHYNVDLDNVEMLKQLTTKLLDLVGGIDDLTALSQKEQNQVIFDFFDQAMANNEDMHHTYLENNLNWVDDVPLANTMTLKFLKSIKPSQDEYTALPKEISDKDILVYGRQLFIKTVNRAGGLDSMIEKELTNWDIDRIALVDKLLMKMAITEFYDFPEIPLRVSINEYIELCKDYSSPKSKVFVNGVLDKIQRRLVEEKQINKPLS